MPEYSRRDFLECAALSPAAFAKEKTMFPDASDLRAVTAGPHLFVDDYLITEQRNLTPAQIARLDAASATPHAYPY